MLAQPFVTVLAAPPHMRGPMLPILPDSCFPGYRTGASGAPEYSNLTTCNNNTSFPYIYFHNLQLMQIHSLLLPRMGTPSFRIRDL